MTKSIPQADSDALEQQLKRFLEMLAPKKVIVAVSGGLDSVVLLHICARLSKADDAAPWQMLVVHVHHGLSTHADAWQVQVESLAKKHGMPFQAHRVIVDPKKGGLENAAREARYQVIAENLCENSVVLTAHHQDDQAETVLLRLCRGAGVDGLAAMAPVRRLGKGLLGRPLLDVSRTMLHAYAQAHGLSWVEDDSNADLAFDRNYMRTEVLPKLAARWPSIAKQLAQTASFCREGADLLQRYAAQQMRTLTLRSEKLGESLDLAAFKQLHVLEQRQVLRYWLDEQGIRMPPKQQFAHLDALLDAADDREPEWHIEDFVLRRFRQRLYCLPIVPPSTFSLALPPISNDADRNRTFSLGVFALRVEISGHGGLDARHAYEIVSRDQLAEHGQGRARSHPVGRGHSQTLKKLLLEYDMPPWLREHVPIVLQGDRIAAVGDYWVDQAFWAGSGQPAWSLQWGPVARS